MKIEEELQAKKKQGNEILEFVKTLPILQRIAIISEGKNLQTQIDNLQKKAQIL